MGLKAYGVASEGVFTPDELIIEIETARKGVIASGQGVLPRGTVLGIVTASGKLLKSASAAADGSQTPDCVLLEDTDTTAGDAEASTMIEGKVNARSLTLGAGHTLATIDLPLRQRGIFVQNTVA